MRIGCLQFAPQVGDVDNNLNRADAVLSKANPKNLDLLVLPELAFSGYNFKSLQHISPYLEPTTAGITSLWARTTALKNDCVVIVGYPEKVDVTPRWPASPEYYSSTITVNADGETIANYRKSFLYYADESWALEGPDGFYDGEIEGLGNVAMGICMDLNPYKFEAPWSAWEFAYHILHKQANLVILSMAWLTREDARSYSRSPKEPDMDTLSYWLARLEPVIRAEQDGEIICVFANRTGTEEEAVYAGTSAVLGIEAGEVKVYGILGRGERELLVVDTNKRPQAKLVSASTSVATDASQRSGIKNHPVSKKELMESGLNPTVSEKSLLSMDATNDDATIAKQLEASQTMDEMVIPLSPVQANSPSLFFAAKSFSPNRDTLHEELKSSISEQEISLAMPGSPNLRRPASPKSRNASRARSSQAREPALIAHELAQDDQITQGYQCEIGPTPPPPPAPHIPSPASPYSAGAVLEPCQSSSTTSPLVPRSVHTAPRPRSTVW